MKRPLGWLFIIMCLSVRMGYAQQWNVIDGQPVTVTGQRDIVPSRYVTFQTDAEAVRNILFNAPTEDLTRPFQSDALLTIGMANGETDVFMIVQYDMMEAGLQAAYPEIETFIGISITNPERRVRADWTTEGFRAVITDASGKTYIDPFQRNDISTRIAYHKSDFSRDDEWTCGAEGSREENGGQRSVGDCVFRSYRLAVAATGEYSNYFGAFNSSQSALVLSQVVTAVNRVNDVYEVDAAVRLILINNTNDVFFYDPGGDPYSGSACTQLSQNQTTITNIIGNSNYDIGHVFDVGSGGCAQLRVICETGSKARGATGLDPPTGDPFYIDYVAHELGHQFGGNHTQNNSCNRNNPTAMEPGSASTIMGYAGICSPNVQPNSDAYFHAVNLNEIATEVTSNGCHVVVNSSNNAPVVSNVPNYSIPVSTPFVLTASATDADNNPLTYCWEQYDNEVGTMPPVHTSTQGPMFRSLTPVASPSRYFYNLPDLTNNINPEWEELPSVGRTMEFRVTVRDLYNGTFGCTDEDNTIVTTVAGIGPFQVTSQNSGATWQEGSTQTITWNVANTTASPVNCANVEIRLSYDGGLTYPVVLDASETNDGSATVTIPDGTTADGRVMVKALNNIFFDINNADITIIEGGAPDFTITLNPPTVSECNDGVVQTTVQVGSLFGFSNAVTLSMLNAPPGAIAVFVPPVVLPGSNSVLTISNLSGLSGSYTPIVRGTSTTGNKDAPFGITFLPQPGTPSLIAPQNNSTDAVMTPLLDWDNTANATSYAFEISENSSFTSVVLSGTSATHLHQVTGGLEAFTQYWWRVRGINSCGTGAWSSANTFTTMACLSYNSTDVPKAIPSGGTPTVTSVFETDIELNITDVNLINLSGMHTFMDNLRFTLIAPDQTEALVWDRPCNSENNFNIHLDDEAGNSNWPCPPTDGNAYRPSNPLFVFDGKASQGTWVLRIQDLVNGDGGSLESWGLRVCGTLPCVLTVDETTGVGSGSLPAALDCASSGDTIFLAASLSGQMVNIGAAALVVEKDITIIALGPDITITGTGARVFELGHGANCELAGMTIMAGTAMVGGAIDNGAHLTLNGVRIERNPNVSGATLLHNTAVLTLEGDCYFEE